MKYPKNPVLIDITKPPYNADNTGKNDCTEVLRKALDDVLIRHIEATEKFKEKMLLLSDNLKKDTFVGFECGRVENGILNITMPEFEPFTKIIYFPEGTYLVSDTVTYTLTDLTNKYYQYGDRYDLSRNIHILGENKESTFIKLKDDAEGFTKGSLKPLLSFNNNTKPRDKEVANTGQMNMLKDITLLMGNNGGIGLKYLSSNIGRVENVDIIGENSTVGIYTVFGSEANFINVTVSGFDYGFDIQYSNIITMNNIDVSRNRKAGILTGNSPLIARNITSGVLKTVEFVDCGRKGRYCFDDTVTYSELNNNIIYIDNTKYKIPPNSIDFTEDNYAFVDNFGAKGDGVSDCTDAIQRAFNSGKEIVLFGEGLYLIENKILVPKTVKYIDFNFCQLAAGKEIISGDVECAFEINEDSEDVLYVENLYTQEQFYGHMHLLKQNCVRDVVLSDLQTTMASMYVNTIGGSKIYLDNIFATTGTYCENVILKRGDLQPIYCKNIPLEFHNQTVIGRGVNVERADLAVLNDGSDILIDGLRTEGPGTAVRTINGGKTTVHISNSGIGHKTSTKPLYEAINSHMNLCGVRASGFNDETEYNIIVKDNNKIIRWEDIASNGGKHYLTMKEYKNSRF